MKIAGCVFLIFCWAITCHGADSVTLRDNKVSVHLVSGSLVKTLETLHKKSGVEFVVKKGIENDRISIDLKQEELEPAVDKLLKNYNKNSDCKAKNSNPKSHPPNYTDVSSDCNAKMCRKNF